MGKILGSVDTDLVPHCGDEHQTRSHCTLEDSQKNSRCDKSDPVLCGRRADHNHAPLYKTRRSALLGRDDFAVICEELGINLQGQPSPQGTSQWAVLAFHTHEGTRSPDSSRRRSWPAS